MKNINLFKHKIPKIGEDFYTLLEHKNIKPKLCIRIALDFTNALLLGVCKKIEFNP